MRDYDADIDRSWPTIVEAWAQYGHLQPIIVCDLEAGTVGAYPARDYIHDLARHEQAETLSTYDRIVAEGRMFVFVRDNAHRVLQSYALETPKRGRSGQPGHQQGGRGAESKPKVRRSKV
jgi:hypothetical protein